MTACGEERLQKAAVQVIHRCFECVNEGEREARRLRRHGMALSPDVEATTLDYLSLESQQKKYSANTTQIAAAVGIG
jgi:hypothetical protein